MKKIRRTIIIEYEKPQGTFYRGPQGGQDKTADYKRDKITDSENETKLPISKKRQKRRFCEKEHIARKIVSLIKASWPNYQYIAIILPITIRKWDTTNLMQFPSLFATN